MADLLMKSLVHQIVEGFAEEVRGPDLGGILLKLGEEIADQILALLLGAYNGGDFGFYRGADEMDGGSAGFQLYPVPP